MGATRVIPVTEIKAGDVVITGDGMAIVRDIRVNVVAGEESDASSTTVHLRLSAGRTDPGTWVEAEAQRASVYRDSWGSGDVSMVRRADTVEAIERWVDDIARSAEDPEQAHVLQDALYAAVLEVIAQNRSDASTGGSAELASAAIRSRSVEFARWMA